MQEWRRDKVLSADVTDPVAVSFALAEALPTRVSSDTLRALLHGLRANTAICKKPESARDIRKSSALVVSRGSCLRYFANETGGGPYLRYPGLFRRQSVLNTHARYVPYPTSVRTEYGPAPGHDYRSTPLPDNARRFRFLANCCISSRPWKGAGSAHIFSLSPIVDVTADVAPSAQTFTMLAGKGFRVCYGTRPQLTLVYSCLTSLLT